MKALSTAVLVHAYKQAVELKLDREFIKLIEKELINRFGSNCCKEIEKFHEESDK